MRSSVPADAYVAYPLALRELRQRIGATSHEIAAWVFHGPSTGGLAAYVNANELDPPPRFSYVMFMHSEDSRDYLSPLMRTWFSKRELATFEPDERYITGGALIERWNGWPGIVPEAFIRAKIHESRLCDLHPILGLTQGSIDEPFFAPLEEALFALSEVQAVELEDFGEVHTSAAGPAAESARTTKEAPTAARSGLVNESSLDRSRRLFRRKLELIAEGNRRFIKQIASEEKLSPTRVKELIERAAKQGPFLGLGETVSRAPVSRAIKGKR